MAGAPESAGGPVRPLTAVALATTGFIALLIFGFGMLSLALNEDVVESPGNAQLPGILGTALATVAFAVALWMAVRPQHPSFWGAFGTMIAAYLASLAGIWLGATGGGVAAATATAGAFALSWFGALVALVAVVAGWVGIALVRTRARHPQWPWEQEED